MEMYLKVHIFVLFTIVYGQEDVCGTLGGKCISIEDCDVLKPLIHKSLNDRDIVVKHQCGFDGSVPRVCCPEGTNCPTLEGNLGLCVSLNTCTYLKDRMNTGKRQDVEYVQRSRCVGATRYHVCCDITLNETHISTYVLPDPATAGGDTEPRFSTECSILNETLGVIPSEDQTVCCGIEGNSGNKIIGGTETAIDEYPWLAVIEYERPYLCGGTLISSLFVLTAAHCLVGDNMKPRGVTSVRLGEYNTANEGPDCVEVEGGGQDCTNGAMSIETVQIFIHPEYNMGDTIVQANDIGLLKLKEKAPYTDFIRPICLPTSDMSAVGISSKLRFHVAGWGAVSETRPRSDVKLQVDLPIVDQKICEKLYTFLGKAVIWEKQFCAGGEPNKDTCKGDSGGPLIYSDPDKKINQIIGITSFGILKCGSEGRPSIYTKVINYVPWILTTIKT